MRNKFECAYRVGNAFEIIALTMCEVIHGVSVPLRPCAVMWRMYYAIHYRIAEVHVGICHIQFGAEHH